MRRGLQIGFCALLFAAATTARAAGQDVVDRIVARVENDIILLSDIQELQRYQELVDGKSESENAILDRLIDQWIVRSEAELSQFPHPTEGEIERGITRVEKSFATPEEYRERKKQSGLTDAEVRKLVASQLYLSNYLDSRFRQSAQVDEKAIKEFYQDKVVPKAKEAGKAPPTLDASREIIREALVQSEITEQADKWLKESRERLHIQKFMEAETK